MNIVVISVFCILTNIVDLSIIKLVRTTSTTEPPLTTEIRIATTASQIYETTTLELTTITSTTVKMKSQATTTRCRGTSRKRSLIKMSMNLEQIPEGYPEIQTLNLAYNSIDRLPPFVFWNNSYAGVKKILLQQNRILNVSVNAFKGIRQIKHIDLSDNLINKIDPYTFKGNNRLHTLILVNNLIYFDRLQTFVLSHSIEHLVLSNNRIDQIYDMTFLGIPNLRSLILNNNGVSTVAPNSFKPLSKLHYLSLAYTNVYRLEDTMFSRIPSTLNLEGTPFGAKFEPALTKVTDNSVLKLLRLSKVMIDENYLLNPN